MVVSGINYKSRMGVDGKHYQYTETHFFEGNYGGDIRRWWEDNRGKSLNQMRTDALEWRIAEEERIGF